LDIEKAFDSVDSNSDLFVTKPMVTAILIQKLNHYGIRGTDTANNLLFQYIEIGKH